ncbi:MAG: phosphoribosylanthranilate isomerase [Syntrophales bacterium]
MKRIIVQLYEIQEPREAEWLVELGVDHIGSVILSPEAWKLPALRDVIRLIRHSPAQSTLIPLITRPDDILRALDYYQPDFVHFCELIPLAPEEGERREKLCAALVGIQELVKREFPPIGIIRSIPIPGPGLADPGPVREAILAVAQILGPHSDYFMTDTLRGIGNDAAPQPVAGYVGITGEVCDWELAKALVAASPIPVILAGGISPENVFDAICRVGSAGIDSCTQTNARDALGKPIRFRKDRERVRRLLDEVRRAEEARAEYRSSESLPDGCEPPGN